MNNAFIDISTYQGKIGEVINVKTDRFYFKMNKLTHKIASISTHPSFKEDKNFK